uniref:UQCRQ n=2 Tax=Euglena gracilis TaxID=3039 RepID=UPI002FE4FB69
MEGHSAYVALEQRVNTRQKGIIQRHLSPYDVDIRGNGFRQIYRLGMQKIRYFGLIGTPCLLVAGAYRGIWVFCERLEDERYWSNAL